MHMNTETLVLCTLCEKRGIQIIFLMFHSVIREPNKFSKQFSGKQFVYFAQYYFQRKE
jgi:hypothetical protein